MKKVLLTIIAIIILTLTTMAKAKEFTTFDLAIYAANKSNFSGFMIGTTIGQNWVMQLNINSTKNLGGLTLAFGKQINQFVVLTGALYGSHLETVRDTINLAGINTPAQDTPEFNNPPLFIEIEHDSGFFLRYTKYIAEYTLNATRFELIDLGPPLIIDAFTASEHHKIHESVLFLGYRIKF